jgi:hypothetical protein
MIRLDDLPNELLSQIALALCMSTTDDSNNDAYNLALVARRFRSIAQDALHTFVSVRDLRVETESYRVGYLARTLIERPDLACKVQELDLALMWKVYSHEEACKSSTNKCVCHWDDMKNLFLGFLDTRELSTKTWAEALKAGFEEAMAGVVLHLLPALHTLTIDNYHQTKYPDFDGNKVLVPRRIDTHYLFGIPVHEFDPSLVPGLANLKHIRSSAHIPWQLIGLSSLKTLHIGILPTILNYPFDVPISTNVTSTITSLTLPMNLVVLENDYMNDIDGRYEYGIFSEKLFEGLTRLKRLNIRLYRNCESRGSRLGDHKTTPPGSSSYDRLLSMFYSSSLETIVLDTSDVDTRAVKNWKSGRNYLESCVDPLSSLRRFPNLKTIIAPQQAFFTSRVQSFPPITYPPSISSIGIIDPSPEIADYVGLIGRIKQAYTPDLSNIEFWCDRNPPLESVRNPCDETLPRLDSDGAVKSCHGSFCSEVKFYEGMRVSIIINQEPRGWRNVDTFR